MLSLSKLDNCPKLSLNCPRIDNNCPVCILHIHGTMGQFICGWNELKHVLSPSFQLSDNGLETQSQPNVKECHVVRWQKCYPWVTKSESQRARIDSTKVLISINNRSLFTQKQTNWPVHQADPGHLCRHFRGEMTHLYKVISTLGQKWHVQKGEQ